MIVLITRKLKSTPNGGFSKKSLLILHLNINSLLPKIDDICYIAKQSNHSIIGISESKLDSSILNSELDIEYKRDIELHTIFDSLYLTTISQIFVVTLKAFL